MFKNLVLFRLPAPWENDRDALEKALATKPFHPCPSNVGQSVGFVQHGEERSYAVQIGGHYLLKLLTETKILPGKAINLHAQKLAKAFEEREGFPPGRKEMREIKEEALHELLPKAPVVQAETPIWIHPESGIVGIEVSSQKKGDDAVQVLLRAYEKLPLKPFATNVSPASWMVQLLLDKGTASFSVDDGCTLQDPDGGTVSYKGLTLSDAALSQQVRSHIAEGKQATQLAMTWDHRISFVLTAKMEIKRIAFLEGADESEDEEDATGLFLLQAANIAQMIGGLADAMGGYQEKGD